MPLLINNEESQQVLNMKDCMDLLEEAYIEEGQGEATNRTKSNIHIPTDNPEQWYRYCSQEGGSRRFGVTAIRIKSDIVAWPWEGTRRRQIWWNTIPGKYCGLVLLFSARNGELLAILNDGYMQHLRVGATAGIAVKHLSRQDSKVIGLLGSGGMAQTHIEAIALVRDIKLVKLYSPTREHREQFAASLRKHFSFKVELFENAREAVTGVDILASCTDAATPSLKADMLEKGLFATTVASMEAEDEVFKRIDRYVTYRSDVGEHHFTTPENRRPPTLGGTSWMTLEKEKPARERTSTLQDILAGKAHGRTRDDEAIYFLSEGTGIQFAAASHRIFEEAKKRGMGRELPLDWFLQDIRN